VPLEVIPSVKDVKDLLDGLLGRDLAVKANKGWAPGAADKLVAAEFVADDGTLSAFVVVDLPLGIYLGAAVGLVPAGGAKDMVKDGELEPMIRENLSEVLNVLSAVFNEANATHVRLGALFAPDQDAASHAAGWIAKVSGQLVVDVEVPGYGAGLMYLGSGGA
jgi:hypothetical protein